VAYDIMTFAGY